MPSSSLDSLIRLGGKREPTLAALFLNSPDKVDKVLEKIDYDDNNLEDLTRHRPELAKSHDSFFRVIDKIKKPHNQEDAISYGVHNLFRVEKHDSVIPLISALENSTLSRNVKNVAIQRAFYEGARRGVNYLWGNFMAIRQ